MFNVHNGGQSASFCSALALVMGQFDRSCVWTPTCNSEALKTIPWRHFVTIAFLRSSTEVLLSYTSFTLDTNPLTRTYIWLFPSMGKGIMCIHSRVKWLCICHEHLSSSAPNGSDGNTWVDTPKRWYDMPDVACRVFHLCPFKQRPNISLHWNRDGSKRKTNVTTVTWNSRKQHGGQSQRFAAHLCETWQTRKKKKRQPPFAMEM